MTAEADLLVEGRPEVPDPGWSLTWVDADHGVAMLQRGEERATVIIEGGPSAWTVTIAGRRVAVTTRSHRQRLLAESSQVSAPRHGAAEVWATLPGMVVAIRVDVGDEVAEGDPLVTIEAMKMQNEIRAPRAGRVVGVEVVPGQAIASGALLVRLEDLDP